jgi:hypothetical protein
VSNYTKSTNFATKDALASGNPLKIVKGTEIDTEFNNIATAVATKADLASPTFTGTPTLPTGTVAVTQSAGNNTTAIATTAFVQAAIALLYPVGSIYTNATVSTNPATLLGFGTWTAFGAGRVMVGFDAGNALFDTAEETGGSADAITVSHTHTATSTDSGHVTHTTLTQVQRLMLAICHNAGAENAPVLAAQLVHNTNTGTGFAITGIRQQQLRLLVQVAQMLTTSHTSLCICGKERHEKP